MSAALRARETCLDVWLKFESEGYAVDPDDDRDDYVSHEANTYRTPDGYRVEWYLNAVGLVKSPPLFSTYEAARKWLEAEGFQDFTS